MENNVAKLHNAVLIAFNYDNPTKRLEAENYILNVAENNPKQGSFFCLFFEAVFLLKKKVSFFCFSH